MPFSEKLRTRNKLLTDLKEAEVESTEWTDKLKSMYKIDLRRFYTEGIACVNYSPAEIIVCYPLTKHYKYFTPRSLPFIPMNSSTIEIGNLFYILGGESNKSWLQAFLNMIVEIDIHEKSVRMLKEFSVARQRMIMQQYKRKKFTLLVEILLQTVFIIHVKSLI
jgi:hypothetical protein